MKRIIGIGGAVIKTGAGEMLKERISDIEMLLLNGGALTHDFQIALEPNDFSPGGYLKPHSVPLSELNVSMKRIEMVSNYIWDWLKEKKRAPENSLIGTCEKNNIPVLLFTALGCDYFHFFGDWKILAERSQSDFNKLRKRFQKPFHYLNFGSAVILPEVFQKAIQGVKHKFRADVVDFLDMYRPRTRVAIYGKYYQMDFETYLKTKWQR